MANRKIQVEIIGDSRSVERAFKRAGKAGSGFDKAMRSLAIGGGAALGVSMLGVGLALRRGFAEVSESQKVMAQTNAVLKSTGQIAGVTAKDIAGLAAAKSKMSGIDDEAIQQAENMLLTFTNIRGKKIFAETTQAALDMSVALGKDLPDSALMIGKAMNDLVVTQQGNVRGFMALRRVGVQISPAMMAQAAAFIKANQPMRAQILLLKELQTEFGNSAQAFGTTLPGSMGRLSNAIDNITGAFVEGLAPVITRVANSLQRRLADPAFIARVRQLGTIIGTWLVNAISRFGKWFDVHWPGIQAGFIQLGAFIREYVIPPLRLAVRLLDRISGAVNTVRSLVPGDAKITTVKQLKEAPGWVQEQVGKQLKKPRSSGAYGVGHRARGGPVMPGMSYMVGERGPEMFMPSQPGTIVPSAQRGGDIVINLDGREIARVSLNNIQRTGKRTASQSRGRYGGQNLALG